jgi:hypothetical protein
VPIESLRIHGPIPAPGPSKNAMNDQPFLVHVARLVEHVAACV